ncbi:MAG: L-lactate permease [Coriobacteriia bacterium]|nr:L-lactate permease [Coriobacteriia bacterium]
MFQASIDPVCGNLLISAIVACIPLVFFFICLICFKLKTHVSALLALATSIIIAVVAFKMPIHLTLFSATEGFAYGILPIALIMFSAVWFYEITVASGRSVDLCKLFDNIGKGDIRIQAILIAFCFGALLEALAGFGAPIAITAAMILALGISPLKAGITSLVANTAPVAFGAIALPIITAGNMAPGPEGAAATSAHVAAITGIIAPLFATFIPCIALVIIDGKKGLKDCFIPALVIGFSFALTQFLVSNFFSYQMTDIYASIISFVVSIIFLKYWKPRGVDEFHKRNNISKPKTSKKEELKISRTFMSILPYILLIIVFGLNQAFPVLSNTDIKFSWPGLTSVNEDGSMQSLILNYDGNDPGTTFNFSWLSNCGSLIIITGILVTIIYSIFNEKNRYKMSIKVAFITMKKTLIRMKYTILTIACVLSLAYVMNFSGQTASIGHLIAKTGIAFAFLSPVLGWVGTAITGSDTSANALFAKLQAEAAKANAVIDVSPDLFLASNTMGGVIGKMISPQSLAIAAATMRIAESTIFKKAIKISLILLLILCVIIFIYAVPLYFLFE